MSLEPNTPLYDVLDVLSERVCQQCASNVAKEMNLNVQHGISSAVSFSDIYELFLEEGLYKQMANEGEELVEDIDPEDKDAIFLKLHPHFSQNTPEYISAGVRLIMQRLFKF